MIRALGSMFLAFALLGGSHTGVLADGDVPVVDLGALAQEILRGSSAGGTDAVATAGALPAEAMLRLLTEIRDQARVYRELDVRTVKDLKWEGMNLTGALAYVRTLTGFPAEASPAVLQRVQELQITLALEQATVSTVLNLMTEPLGLVWGARGNTVRLMTTTEAAVVLPPSLPTPR